MPLFYVGFCPKDGTVYTPISAYSYGTGGLSVISVSATQNVSVGKGATSVTFNGTIDDFVVLIPAVCTLPISYNSGTNTYTVSLPDTYLILKPNHDDFTGAEIDLKCRQISTKIIPEILATDAAIQIVAAGFNAVDMGSPIPISILTNCGICNPKTGNMSFLVILVPSGVGQATISSASSP